MCMVMRMAMTMLMMMMVVIYDAPLMVLESCYLSLLYGLKPCYGLLWTLSLDNSHTDNAAIRNK